MIILAYVKKQKPVFSPAIKPYLIFFSQWIYTLNIKLKFLSIIIALVFHLNDAVYLDRDLLNLWYKYYSLNTTTIFFLNGRDITGISPNTFTGLIQMQSLWLDGNSITSLDTSLFLGLNKLQNLLLSYNDLSVLEAPIFDELTELQSLEIGGNGLISLDSTLFKKLVQLSFLDLSSNQIVSIDRNVFEGSFNDNKPGKN